MAEIVLSNGLVALCDDADYEELSQYKWQCVAGYAARSISRKVGRGMIFMHQQILGVEPGKECDHWDENKLNNRRGNLRSVTHSENLVNHKNRPNHTGWRGIAWVKQMRQWLARARLNKVTHQSEFYNSPRMAALAYNELALRLYGPKFRFFNPVFQRQGADPTTEQYRRELKIKRGFEGWRGVRASKRGGYDATFQHDGRSYYGGRFETRRMAALAYNGLAITHVGPGYSHFNQVFQLNLVA